MRNLGSAAVCAMAALAPVRSATAQVAGEATLAGGKFIL